MRKIIPLCFRSKERAGVQKKGIKMNSSESNSIKSLSDFYIAFCGLTIRELEKAILNTDDLDERGFYRKILNLKLQTEQEKIVGERLV